MTRYIWDVVSDNVLMETSNGGDTSAVYTHEPDRYGRLISQRRSGQSSFYHFDGQGSTRVLTSENESITDTYTYTAFGERVERTGTTNNPFEYKGSLGYHSDSVTEGINVRFRVYQPPLGRWLSVDPLRFIDGANPYRYAYNSPTIFVDPSGLTAECAECEAVISSSVKNPLIESSGEVEVNSNRLLESWVTYELSGGYHAYHLSSCKVNIEAWATSEFDEWSKYPNGKTNTWFRIASAGSKGTAECKWNIDTCECEITAAAGALDTEEKNFIYVYNGIFSVSLAAAARVPIVASSVTSSSVTFEPEWKAAFGKGIAGTLVIGIGDSALEVNGSMAFKRSKGNKAPITVSCRRAP